MHKEQERFVTVVFSNLPQERMHQMLNQPTVARFRYGDAILALQNQIVRGSTEFDCIAVAFAHRLAFALKCILLEHPTSTPAHDNAASVLSDYTGAMASKPVRCSAFAGTPHALTPEGEI